MIQIIILEQILLRVIIKNNKIMYELVIGETKTRFFEEMNSEQRLMHGCELVRQRVHFQR